MQVSPQPAYFSWSRPVRGRGLHAPHLLSLMVCPSFASISLVVPRQAPYPRGTAPALRPRAASQPRALQGSETRGLGLGQRGGHRQVGELAAPGADERNGGHAAVRAKCGGGAARLVLHAAQSAVHAAGGGRGRRGAARCGRCVQSPPGQRGVSALRSVGGKCEGAVMSSFAPALLTPPSLPGLTPVPSCCGGAAPRCRARSAVVVDSSASGGTAQATASLRARGRDDATRGREPVCGGRQLR